MGRVLDYAPPHVARPRIVPPGVLPALISVLSAISIVYLAHAERMSMVTWRGEWCGTGPAMSEQNLYLVGLLLIVPACSMWVARRVRLALAVCRGSLLVSVCGWLV